MTPRVDARVRAAAPQCGERGDRGDALDRLQPPPSFPRAPSPLHPAGGSLRLQLDFDITYTAPARRAGQPGREILRAVKGRLRPGRLTAILGPSGAGKTSCLSILAGHRCAGVQARLLVNGEEMSPDGYRGHCVLIAQEFALLGALTARETLRVAADLKLPSSKYSSKDREAVVEEIASILGLETCLETVVRHLSGGEKKRLSIGVELVTNPPVMLFDEPTSGLDSVSSVQVVSHLRSLARGGRTVAVVLHQPSSRLFQLFDDVLVIGSSGPSGRGQQEPGRALYCGPVDEAASAFAAAGFPCPTFYNIADYVVEVASGEHGEDLAALFDLVGADAAAEAGNDDETCTETDAMLAVKEKKKEQEQSAVILEMGRVSPMWPAAAASSVSWTVSYPVSFWVQFAVLFKRSIRISVRDMNMAWLRFAAHLLVAVMLGFLYKDVGNEASKVTGNVACLFFFVLFLFFSNAMPTVLTFPLEAAVFFREHANNWYSLTAYYLSKVLADLPFMVVNPTVFMLMAYFLTDQPTDGNRRCMVWLMCLLTVLLAHSYGLLFGAALGMQLGVFFVPASTIPLILFSGFFLHIPDIPEIMRWLSYVSNFRYGFEGTVISVYGLDRQPLKCSLPYCHWKRPLKFLQDLGMSDSNYWTDVIGLSTWIITLHILLLITLKVKVIFTRR